MALIRPAVALVMVGGAVVSAVATAYAMNTKGAARGAVPGSDPISRTPKKPAKKPAAKKPVTPAAKPDKPPPKQLPSGNNSTTVVSEIPDHAVHVETKPTPAPAPKPATPKKRSARQAATDLYEYAAAAINAGKAASLGDKTHSNPFVKKAQSDMGKLDDDGVYADKTRARGKELLGKPFPARTSKPKAEAPAPKPKTTPAPKPSVEVIKQHDNAMAEQKKNDPKGTKAYATARELDKYLMAGGRSRTKIADLQWALGLDADGIPGDEITKPRVEHLLGVVVQWPDDIEKQLTGAVPGGSTAKQASDRLVRYYRDHSGRRSERISAYQRMLGVQPVGTVGPQTKAKVKELSGVEL